MGDPHPPSTEPILSIDTLTPVDFITVDGRRGDLRPYRDLSLFEIRRFERLRDRMQALQLLEAPAPEDELELADLLDQMCRLVLAEPAGDGPSIHARLLAQDRMRIITVFLRPPRLRRAVAAEKPAKGKAAAPASITSSSSQDSSDSTEPAIRPPG
jgi:hypothetical protein